MKSHLIDNTGIKQHLIDLFRQMEDIRHKLMTAAKRIGRLLYKYILIDNSIRFFLSAVIVFIYIVGAFVTNTRYKETKKQLPSVLVRTLKTSTSLCFDAVCPGLLLLGSLNLNVQYL